MWASPEVHIFWFKIQSDPVGAIFGGKFFTFTWKDAFAEVSKELKLLVSYRLCCTLSSSTKEFWFEGRIIVGVCVGWRKVCV